MQNPIDKVLTVDADWRRWIAENLLLDINPSSICATLINLGVEPLSAQREINAALQSPYLLGAQRLKNRLRKHDWVLDCQRRMNRLIPSEIPRVEGIKADAFLHDYYSAGRPVIITGMMENWPALHLWNFDYFIQNLGEQQVQVQFGRNADTQYELNKLRHQKIMPFGEFTQMVRDAGPTNDYYMTANNDSMNRLALAALWDDIIAIPEYLDPDISGHGFLWFGPAGTVTPFHHDQTNNFMAQVIGSKRVLIAHACEISQMYNHTHCFTDVDARHIDYKQFPAMRDVRILSCEIHPGELLFLPVGCWHFVESLTVSVTMSFTNFRWDNHFMDRYPEQVHF